AAADGGHGRGAVRLGDLGDDAQRVAKVFGLGQQPDQRALREPAVADLAPLGEAVAPRLAGGVRGHVVVEHEALAVFAGQRVDDLLVAPGAERDRHQRLGLAAGKQRRAVGARQHADPHGDRAHGARVAAVDARLAVEDLAAHDLRLEVEADVLHGLGSRTTFGAYANGLEYPLPDRVDRFRARLLLLDAERLAQVRLGELVDRLDRGLHLLVAVGHAAEHDVLGELERLRLHHHHARLGAGDDQVQLRLLQLARRGVEDVLAVDVADAARADGPVERHARQGQRRRHADHRRDVRVDFRIERQNLRHDLDFVVEAVGEQRPDRPIDEARGQRLFFGGAAFALEEAAGDLARRVGLLGVVDGQREEFLPGLGGFRRGDRGEDDGVVHRDQHRTVRLAGDLAGLEGDLVVAVGKRFLDRVHLKSFVTERERAAYYGDGLLAQTEAVDQDPVLVRVRALQVIQQLA